MEPTKELFEIAGTLKNLAAAGDAADIVEPLQAIKRSATEVGRSFSGSWLGYHARVYYANFVPPPAGANFSQEWGIQDRTYSDLGSKGDWRQYDPLDVKSRIRKAAGDVDWTAAKAASKQAAEGFVSAKLEILSILENAMSGNTDNFLERLKDDLEKIDVLSGSEIARIWSPKGQIMTRDTLALGQGNQVPPHIQELADVASMSQSFEVCKAAASICEKAASHLERRSKRQKESGRIGTNVFIGHGGSQAWRQLKDFIQDRIGLPWDEFNRVPVAGVTNIARLSEMLDASAIAFVVMTAEDELLDGEIQARMNVVHEAGLFQGRLGFTKAIVLMEDGCKEFSNIQGLGQIRFPKNNIAAAFEEIRRVLEREGLIES
jgi:predicted nucleotide-binding protein